MKSLLGWAGVLANVCAYVWFEYYLISTKNFGMAGGISLGAMGVLMTLGFLEMTK